MLLLIYLNRRIWLLNCSLRKIDLLEGNVTFREGRFNGDVGDETVGATDVDECCIGRTTATGRDDWD